MTDFGNPAYAGAQLAQAGGDGELAAQMARTQRWSLILQGVTTLAMASLATISIVGAIRGRRRGVDVRVFDGDRAAARKRHTFDPGLIPGSRSEQKRRAQSWRRKRGQKPFRVFKAAAKRWHLEVMGTDIGYADTRELACAAAHSLARYRYDMGDFVHTYAEGCPG